MSKKIRSVSRRKNERHKCNAISESGITRRSIYGKSRSEPKTQSCYEKKGYADTGGTQQKITVDTVFSLWLSDIQLRVKESTYSNYRMKVQKHILPYFNGIIYESLTAQSINSFIQEKIESGLSENYVSDIVMIIKAAAKFVNINYNYTDRTDRAVLPKSREKAEKTMLSAKEQETLRRYLIENRSYSNTGILLAAATGIRIGELCALRWSDIDLGQKLLTVNRTLQRIQNKNKKGTHLITSSPKSSSSVRQIPLPDFMIPILELISTNDDSFVLSGTNKMTEPRTMQYRFKSILKKLRLTNVSFHSLRHAFATNCVALGFDVKTLSEILGHSSVEITLNRYVHSSMERKRDCMKLLSDSIYVA